MNNIVFITQARMDSYRLPGKTMAPIFGQPMILWHCARVAIMQETIEESNTIFNHIVATSGSDKDRNILMPCLSKHGISSMFMEDVSPSDVLSRIFLIAKDMQAETIVRLCGDCPFVDPWVITECLNLHFLCGNDLTALSYEWADGLDVEVIKMDALEKAYLNADEFSDREHVTPYIWSRKDEFQVGHLPCPIDLSNHAWSVDTFDGLNLADSVFRNLYPKHSYKFNWANIYGYMLENLIEFPDRNKSYTQQISTDKTWREIRYGNK